MPVSKVVLNDETMIDLTSDTITSDALIDGVTAHDAAGNQITDTLQSPADAVSQHNLDPAAQTAYFTEKNYFMVSRDYCSLHSRFGFHFVYRSESTGKVLLAVTVTAKDY